MCTWQQGVSRNAQRLPHHGNRGVKRRGRNQEHSKRRTRADAGFWAAEAEVWAPFSYGGNLKTVFVE